MTEPRSPLDIIRHVPFCAEAPAHALLPSVTPSASVYVRSNFPLPPSQVGGILSIGGAVSTPCSVLVDELRPLPQHSMHVTMECAGNDRLTMRPLPQGEPWSDGAVSTALWTGVPVRELLARAGVDENAVEVLFTARDSGVRADAEGLVTFARSIPLQVAMHPDTILALKMNDSDLTQHHGAPLRLVVPGWYGMASVKWVTRIDVLTAPFTGYFQRQRYVYEEARSVTPVTKTRVKSIITSPLQDTSCTRETTVRGWAWSGFGAITRVELSVDGVENWLDARLGAPESPYSWTQWELPVRMPHSGRVALRSRATDSAGNVQPQIIEWNRFGYGNNAVRVHLVDVLPP